MSVTVHAHSSCGKVAVSVTVCDYVSLSVVAFVMLFPCSGTGTISGKYNSAC